jgi:hypothetical protein
MEWTSVRHTQRRKKIHGGTRMKGEAEDESRQSQKKRLR